MALFLGTLRCEPPRANGQLLHCGATKQAVDTFVLASERQSEQSFQRRGCIEPKRSASRSYAACVVNATPRAKSPDAGRVAIQFGLQVFHVVLVPLIVVRRPHEVGCTGLPEKEVEIAYRTEVERLPYVANPGVATGKRLAHRPGVVRRGVIRDDQLEITKALSQQRCERSLKQRHPVLFECDNTHRRSDAI